MFLKVHSKRTGKEICVNFDHVMFFLQEEDKTVLETAWTKGRNVNVTMSVEVTESANELFARLNGCDVIQESDTE